MTLREAIVVALEALEVGDTSRAVSVLLEALDGPSRLRSYRCECGSGFEWPGLLEAHREMCRRWAEAA